MFDIYEGVTNSFQLVFKEQHINIKFERRPENILTLSIGPVKALRDSYLIRKKNIRGLENLGFIFEPLTERYVYQYDLSTLKDILVIKTLLARLI